MPVIIKNISKLSYLNMRTSDNADHSHDKTNKKKNTKQQQQKQQQQLLQLQLSAYSNVTYSAHTAYISAHTASTMSPTMTVLTSSGVAPIFFATVQE
jgi:hypothetical protein